MPNHSSKLTPNDKTRFLFLRGTVGFIAITAILLTGCFAPAPPTLQESDILQQMVADGLAAKMDGVPRVWQENDNPPVHLPWIIHLDTATDMAGFFAPTNGTFLRLLNRLDGQMPPGSGFVNESRGLTNNALNSNTLDGRTIGLPETYANSRPI